MIETIDAVILAGGRSRRMGQNKALLPFGGAPSLACYQYIKLSKIFESCYIVAKKRDDIGCKANFLIERSDTHSVLGAIVFALEALKKPLFVLAVDMPLVDTVLIGTLYEKFTQTAQPVAAKDSSFLHPLCAIYPPSLLPTLKVLQEKQEERLTEAIKQCGFIYQECDESRLINLNYYHQYHDLLSHQNR